MAIYHASMKPVSRASGRSAVASAAYRAGERLTNERDGVTHDFTRKEGVEHAEIVLPQGVSAEWAKSREKLWNAAEFAESRKDARVAREFEIALPHELTAEQRLELTREFAQDLANRYGAAIDFAIHKPHDASDVRNHHAHLLMTTRRVTEQGLGEKTYIERENKWLLKNDLPTSHMQLRDIRQSWESHANQHLAIAGHDIRIDHRSHQERGLELEPTEHMGVHATQMQRSGRDVSRGRIDEDAAKRNAELIREKPEQVLSIVTNEKSVFDRHDIARTLHRYINDDAQAFQNAFATVMASPALVELQHERSNPETGEIELARYSTREMVELESAMADRAYRMGHAHDHGVDRSHVDRAIEKQDAAIRASAGDDTARLSDEQRKAIEHITGPERIAAVIGYAGAGKSTMLAAAREAWEAQGYTVHGAALSGKAAEGLEESSGIRSRTLASYEHRWQNDRGTIGRSDVFVIDEAGMIGSRQLSRFVTEAEQRGAKIVLVGDNEQLQAIGAGAPFRAIAEQIGHAELSEIRRQRVEWQREASVDFATHRTAEGLAAYRDNGNIRLSETRDDARGEIVRDYLADRDERPEGTRVAMAHRRADVRAINDEIRSALQERGELAKGSVPGDGSDAGALTFQTNDGKREFAPGDRIVFLENDRDLGVKNGMLGTVERVEAGRPGAGPMIVAQLDGPGGKGRGDSISVPTNDYRAFDHGYATTIHKNQGATVDRAFVMASGTMDRHLTYVAMTRHRDSVQLYAGMDEFADRNAGRLIEHGAAPFEHKEGNSESYFVTLENDKGQQRTIWGVDLERAMKEATPEIGEKIGLQHEGSTPVTLPDGTQTHRNAWKVQDAGELAYRQLENRLSRSGVKETTLDYTRDFAERRGIAEQTGIVSEIDLAPAQKRGQEAHSLALPSARAVQDRSFSERSAYEERTPSRTGPERSGDPQQRQRRGTFDGLKLGRSAAAERPTVQDRSEQTETPRGSMFDGLKLNAAHETSAAHDEPGRRERLQEAPAQERLARPSNIERAIDRYARAYDAAERNHREGLPILETQSRELQQAGHQLDHARPGASALMASALQHDPETRQAMTELSGRERVGQLSAGMDRERAAQADPNVRAERFVQRWQDLQDERTQLRGWQNDEARGKVEGQMHGMVKGLESDPQVESILRDRSDDLGIRNLQQSQNLSRAMEQQLTENRNQSIGIER